MRTILFKPRFSALSKTSFFSHSRLFSVPVTPDSGMSIVEEYNFKNGDNNDTEKNLSALEVEKKKKERKREYDREYNLKNKEKRRGYKYEYGLRNKEKIQEYDRLYNLKNKEIKHDNNMEYKLKNKEKLQEYDREYKLKNKEKIKKYNREYKFKNRDKIQIYKREYWLKNKEKGLQYDREYYIKNREKRKVYDHEYYLKNKEKLHLYYSKKRKEVNENCINRKNRNFWSNITSLRKFFDFVGSLLHIKEHHEWYRISNRQIHEHGGKGLFTSHPTLGDALNTAYPEEEALDASKFNSGAARKSTQRWLVVQMKILMPNENIVEDYNHPSLFWESGMPVQLDIFVPRLNLAVEYQGEQHFQELYWHGSGKTLDDIVARDKEKLQICKKNGITLVSIPYWWDKTSESLCSILAKYYPGEFTPTEKEPVPVAVPTDFPKRRKKGFFIKDYIMEGLDWNDEDPEGWFMSEKLDGIRAYWDGEQLWTKRGNVINVPKEFTCRFPDYHLDGELWGGYEDVERSNALLKLNCRKNVKSSLINWNDYKYSVFDAPEESGNYGQRHKFLENNLFRANSDFLSLIPIEVCTGMDHLQTRLKEVAKKGGEGIMIYNPDSPYEIGRTNNLLKVKQYDESVVKYMHQNPKSFSFVCQQDNGQICIAKCGSSSVYFNPPEPGAEITVRHLGSFPKSQKYKHPVIVFGRSSQY